MTTKHTPGPWEFRVHGGWLISFNTPDHKGFLGKYLGEIRGECLDHDEQIANAQLIAAAPELLEALRALLDMITDNRTHGKEIDKAVSVILKAEGGNL